MATNSFGKKVLKFHAANGQHLGTVHFLLFFPVGGGEKVGAGRARDFILVLLPLFPSSSQDFPCSQYWFSPNFEAPNRGPIAVPRTVIILGSLS